VGNSERQFVQYAFYKVDPAWRLLPEEQRDTDKREFMAVYDEFSGLMPMLRSYSLVGIRGDVDFMLWKASDDLETLQTLGSRLLGTGLGKWLRTPYVYLAGTRESLYIRGHRHEGQEGIQTKMGAVGSKYLFVYPFVKTRAWYTLPIQDRHRMMGVHFKVGHDFPSIKIHTAYSYGIDDQEFMLGFEGDNAHDFVDLVIAL
jgi:chlorite dismutase